MGIGKLIRLEMMKQGLKPADVASKAGCTVSTLYKALKGRKIRETTLFRIQLAVGLLPEAQGQDPPDELLAVGS